MTLKEEIKKVLEEYCDVETIEIATLKVGIVAVWVNGKRFGNYDLNKHDFISLMA